MANKLSPRDFDSITTWIKQYTKEGAKPIQVLKAPVFSVTENTWESFTFEIINENDVNVNVVFDGVIKDTILPNSSIKMTYLWADGQMSYNKGYKFTQDEYKDSEISYLFVTRPDEPTYDVILKQPENGTITCEKTTAKEGEQVTVIVTADEGYEVDKVLIDGVESETTFTMPAHEVVVSAEISWIIYGTLEAPTYEEISNDSTQLIYSIKNSNAVDVLFNGETVSASGALELTHIWSDSETSFLVEGYFSADHYINSAELIETVDKPSEPITLPVKGDLITMSLGNATPASGTQDLYRVLKIEGSVAEVVAMFDISTSQKFGSSQVYAGSLLDTALNTTWYGTLNDTAKTAIVDNTFKQDSWYEGTSGSPVYSGYYGTSNPGTSSYSVSLANASFGSEITRKVYALSVQDILDYVTDTSVGDGLLQNYNIWKMFWNVTSQPDNRTYPWLRSASSESSYKTWRIYGNYGASFETNYDYNYSSASRPAFKIDLSKIDYSIEE